MATSARLLLAAVATMLLGAIGWWCLRRFGAQGVVFAFALNWLAMAWMGATTRLFPILLPERCVAIRPFERSGRLYELLGVRVLKRLVRRGPLHRFNPELRLRTGRARLERRMQEVEAAHAVLFVLVLPVAVHAAVRGWWWAAAWTLVFDLLLNVWPVLLQRYNRAWLLRTYGPATRTSDPGEQRRPGVR